MSNFKKSKRKKAALTATAVMMATMWTIPAYASLNTKVPAAVSQDATTADAPRMLSLFSSTTGGSSVTGDENNAKITKEQAQKLLSQYIKIPEDYKLQNTRYGTDRLIDGKRTYWSMSFVKRVNNKHLGTIEASLDAQTGQLLRYYSHLNNPTAKITYPLKVDRKAARELADKFINQLAADYKDSIRFNETYGVETLPPLDGKYVHTLRFDRLVDGIPYLGNYIDLSIDSEGHVQAFDLNWDETIDFPKVSSYLSDQEAVAKMKEAALQELQKVYVLPHNVSGKQKPILSYQLPAFAIDAVTGAKAEKKNRYYPGNVTVSEKPLTDKPSATEPQAGKLSEKEAIAAVAKLVALPEGSELVRSSFNEQQEEEGQSASYWQLNWEIKKNDKEIGNIYARVNATNGLIQSFYQYQYDESDEAGKKSEGVTLAEAVAKAEKVVKQQLPWLTDELYLVKPDENQFKDKTAQQIGSYGVSFEHKKHGATINYDHVSVSIDAQTGEIQNFEANITDVEYPVSSPKTIEPAKAVEQFLQYYNLQLTYRLDVEYWSGGEPLPIDKVNVILASGERLADDIVQKQKVQLVYDLSDKPRAEPIFLDAEAGQWRLYSKGVETTLDLPRATDLAGHWAEEALQLMVAYRAIDLIDGKVNPNQTITRGELIKMLVLASNSGRAVGLGNVESTAMASFKDVSADSDYFAYLSVALQQNLIDVGDGTFNPDAVVSRDDMSELVVRALGYNTLASYEDIFAANFKDAKSIKNKGQAAITVGLQIMTLKDGKFQPEKQVTRAEAATAFFRYLQKRAELQEAPLRM